ncbi:hypothetical protein THAOC_16655 [Thalassiosira oceanica]|uniref:F-box domain-containing protein n=1 Tax=Thalassiosira oceanica TaxID=159749 RepID=K0SX06_THAOC|nr:hypothetical protein THAOC_16655 [Thalassiosira oceanica]|eukprot:EJK62722.1 hypothetical protein THAOC_16655 [Thalassiosira oceanica]
MAGDGRAKRLKTAEGGIAAAAAAEVAELRRRNAELESENERLRRLRARNAELESEIEQLRRRARRGDDHETLTVSTLTVVDLSRVDTSLVAQIFSFLGTSHELHNLALACKSFGWRLPTSSLNWSLVEEIARQAVCSQAADAEMSSLPQYATGAMSWLSILNRFEQPLLFDVLLGSSIEYQNGDEATVQGTGNTSTALSSDYVMRSGSHYAEYEIIVGLPYIGVVRPMPGLDVASFGEDCCYFVGDESFYPRFLARAQRSVRWGAYSNVHVCEYNISGGNMAWADWEDEEHLSLHWEGMESCGRGDTVGMLLNLDEGTLTVYKNSRRLGVMKDGLSGSYCWYATVDENEIVAIKRGIPPNIDSTMST